MAGQSGYAFQPEWNEEELEAQQEFGAAAAPAGEEVGVPAAEAGILANTYWCQCGNCAVMPTARECICCHEIAHCRERFCRILC